MALPVFNFMLSLAAAMAADDGSLVLGRDLFVLEASENGTGAYGVLLVYGGGRPEDLVPLNQRSIQVMVSGPTAGNGGQGEALALAERFFDTLHDDALDAATPAQPRALWTIPGKMLDVNKSIVADPARDWQVTLVTFTNSPGLLGRDERGRAQVSFNFDVRFQEITDG